MPATATARATEDLHGLERVTRRRVVRAVVVALLCLVAAGATVGVLALNWNGLPTSTPSCSWSLNVRGPANNEQVGLVRCYVRALALSDRSALLAVADEDAPFRITDADLAQSEDARIGVATATFVPDAASSAVWEVDLAFADGTKASLAMVLANPQSSDSWRLQIGTPASSTGPTPPPVEAP